MNSKKYLKINIINNKSSKMKTPLPKNVHKSSSSLLLDHDTIIKNKKRKINYNGYYHLPSFANKKSKHNKIQSEIIINKKEITKDYIYAWIKFQVFLLIQMMSLIHIVFYLQIILYLFFYFFYSFFFLLNFT